ncbi:MAG TPA: IPT/TIG domain-containing protein [Egibacteraceae bacterium]|nr:IPT/TIG domain-containing protein [Egibacteraceae bacterium]
MITGVTPRRHRLAASIAVTAALLVQGLHHAPPAGAQVAAVAAKIAPLAVAYGHGVTIAGDGLADTTSVTFLGAPGGGDDVTTNHVIAQDAKKVVAQVPAGAVSGPLAVTSAQGTVTTGSVTVTIVPPPQITSLSHTAAGAGQEITITGADLMGSKKPQVMFGAKAVAPGKTSTSTALTVKVPALPGGPVALRVTTTGGTAQSNFYIAPSVKSVTPAVGSTTGGSVVTITGSGFTGVDGFVDDPATPAVNERLDGVTIGGNRVTRLVAVSDTEIVAETPAGNDGAAPVVVRTTDGSTTAAASFAPTFTYQPLPTITALTPNYNGLDDPRPVVLTGRNLSSATRVFVGAVQVTDVVVDPEAGTMTFTPPASARAAVVNVTATNTDSAGKPYSAAVPFGYVAAPTVGKLVPATAQAGASVVVNGTGFAQGTSVSFGATAASCVVVSFAQLRCTVPAGSGTADVTVTNAVGTSPVTPAGAFTYLAGTASAAAPVGAPVAAGLAPGFGVRGSTIALRGNHLHTATRVEFTGAEDTWVNAPNFLAAGSARLVVTVPAGAVTGPVRVTNPSGTAITEAMFTKVGRPAITSIDVVGDATYGATPGDLVTIRGTGLFVRPVKTTVTIGGKIATVLAKPAPTARVLVVRVRPRSAGERRSTSPPPWGPRAQTRSCSTCRTSWRSSRSRPRVPAAPSPR